MSHNIIVVVIMVMCNLLQVHNTLTFWKDGFSVDDGPLRTGESDEDRKFIEAVSKG